jgi:hypothetical protein
VGGVGHIVPCARARQVAQTALRYKQNGAARLPIEPLAAGGCHGQELRSQCLAYVLSNFTECAATPVFVGLASSIVASLIGSNELRVDSEEDVLTALRRWFEHESSRFCVQTLEELVPLVRFPLLPQEAQLQLESEPLLLALLKVGSPKLNQLWMECSKAFEGSEAAVCCPRLKLRQHTTRLFTFDSVDNSNAWHSGDGSGGRFDQAGVLHHIATEGGTSTYVNPHAADRVVASSSSRVDGSIEDFVSWPCVSEDSSGTDNQPNSWMAVDLGMRRRLTVNHYALRHAYPDGDYCLRDWELQGSEDGVAWTTLRQHDDDETMEEMDCFVAHWAVEGVTTAYRHFRVHQHGQNSTAATTLWGCPALVCECGRTNRYVPQPPAHHQDHGVWGAATDPGTC